MTTLPPEFVAPKYNAIINQIHEDFWRIHINRNIINEIPNIHWLINHGKTEWGNWYD